MSDDNAKVSELDLGEPGPKVVAGLKEGDKGPEVLRLCGALSALGYWLAAPTDTFAPKLTSVVKWFQATNLDDRGRVLDQDGVVGPRTWWALSNSRAEAMRQHLFAAVPKGLSGVREQFLRAALADHARGTKEMPDGSNSGDGVTRFLPGGRPIPWCMSAVAEWWRDATGNYPFNVRWTGVLKFRDAAAASGVYFGRKKWNPAPGDLAIWDFGRGQGHVAVILAVDENPEIFTSVGGNETNSVRVRNRGLKTEKSLVGWARLAGDTGAGFQRGVCVKCAGPTAGGLGVVGSR